MLRVGSPVQLHSLVKQPELNGLRGTIVQAADTATGRFAVRMDPPSQQQPGRLVTLLPANLIDLAAEAMAGVFGDTDLLRVILTFIERWVRAGILTGVSSEWRSCIWSHPDLYKSIVVLATPRVGAQQPTALHNARDESYGARKFMIEGALPVLARVAGGARHPCSLESIPDLAWVERLFVERGMSDIYPAENYCVPLSYPDSPLSSVVKFTFPMLTTLMLHGVVGDVAMRSWVVQNQALSECFAWLSKHLAHLTLKHLHLGNDQHLGNDATLFAESLITQPGLESIQLPDTTELGALDIVKGWPIEVRSKLTALDVMAHTTLADLKQIMELLPNLRRLGWNAEPGWPDYNGALTMELSPAIEDSKLEALYLQLTDFALPIWAFDYFAVVDGPSTFRELVVTCREGSFRYDFGDGEDGGLATEGDAMNFVQKSLPQATALIINADALREGSLYNWDDPDPLHRVLLPATREAWHRAPGTRGLENLAL